MNVPTNLFMWIMACLPIIVLLLLLIKFQWGATEAAPIGLLITIITAVAFYKADFTLLASETAKGIWSALPILLIVWTAILLYQVADEAKAFLVIRNGMRKLLPNELLLVLALGWILESFLQGITGFGVPVAVGAPLLIGIGMHPMWAVILPTVGWPFGVFLMKQFSETVPTEILEAARVDGAGELRTFFSVVFPMIKPGIGALAIFTFVNTWNDYFLQLVMLTSERNWTLPLAIANLQGEMSSDFGLIMAGAALASIPIIVVFIAFQKYFTQGIAMGAVKG